MWIQGQVCMHSKYSMFVWNDFEHWTDLKGSNTKLLYFVFFFILDLYMSAADYVLYVASSSDPVEFARRVHALAVHFCTSMSGTSAWAS